MAADSALTISVTVYLCVITSLWGRHHSLTFLRHDSFDVDSALTMAVTVHVCDMTLCIPVMAADSVRTIAVTVYLCLSNPSWGRMTHLHL